MRSENFADGWGLPGLAEIRFGVSPIFALPNQRLHLAPIFLQGLRRCVFTNLKTEIVVKQDNEVCGAARPRRSDQ